MLANLTATQTRCNVLLDEARTLRRELGDMEPLADVVRELGEDEQRVLLCLARRLRAGQQAYGKLDVANDERDWRHERAEELADALIYGAIAEVKAMGSKR